MILVFPGPIDPTITYTIIRAGPQARAISPVGASAEMANPRLDEAQPSRDKTVTKSDLLHFRFVRWWTKNPKNPATRASIGSSANVLLSRYSMLVY